MSKFTVKKLPPIRLVDLLRKRKTNLKDFLSSSGIVAYTTLKAKCDSMGVSAPAEEEFKQIVGENISSPQEGVIVLDPPKLLKDSGEKINIPEANFQEEKAFVNLNSIGEETLANATKTVEEATIDSLRMKKSLKKKKETVTEES